MAQNLTLITNIARIRRSLKCITHQKTSSKEESYLDTQCESKWIKLALYGPNPIFIGCFYRQPNSNIDPLIELEKSLKDLPT